MSINFNDLPSEIKYNIFAINRRDAQRRSILLNHLRQIRNYRPKYWPYCFHNRACYESFMVDSPQNGASSYMPRFLNLRASGFVYNERFHTTCCQYNFNPASIRGYAIDSRVPMAKLQYKLTQNRVLQYESDDSDSDSDED